MNLIRRRDDDQQESKTLDSVIAERNRAIDHANAKRRRARLCYVHRVRAEYERKVKGLSHLPVDERMLRGDWEAGLLSWWIGGSLQAITEEITAREQAQTELTVVRLKQRAESERLYKELEDARRRLADSDRIAAQADQVARIEGEKVRQLRSELEIFLARDHAVRQGVRPDLWRAPDPAHEPKRQQPQLAIALDVPGYLDGSVSNGQADAICSKYNNEAIRRAELEWSKVHRGYEMQLTPDDISLLDSGEAPKEAA